LDLKLVWAAAGTPRHIFSLDPAVLPTPIDGEATDFTA